MHSVANSNNFSKSTGYLICFVKPGQAVTMALPQRKLLGGLKRWVMVDVQWVVFGQHVLTHHSLRIDDQTGNSVNTQHPTCTSCIISVALPSLVIIRVFFSLLFPFFSFVLFPPSNTHTPSSPIPLLAIPPISPLLCHFFFFYSPPLTTTTTTSLIYTHTHTMTPYYSMSIFLST